MGAVTGLLGVGGGSGGTSFGAPGAANIAPLATEQQVQDAQKQQQAMIQALTQQGGIQNQAALYSQLGNIAAGRGPNPAQAQLAQATGANVANQAALMAGQRGAAANPGMVARLAAQQGGNLQQQAAGQGATMQAQQQLAALQAQQQLAEQQVAQQQSATQDYTKQLMGGLESTNQLAAQQQASINAANAQMATARLGQQQGMLGGVMPAAGKAVGFLGDKLGQFGSWLASSIGGIGAGTGQTLWSGSDMLTKGALGSGGAGASTGEGLLDASPALATDATMVAAEGGEVPNMPKVQTESGPKSHVGKYYMFKGGKVPVMVSPGERYLPPQEVQKVAEGKKEPMKAGEYIPGTPKVKGAKNSYQNDTVPKTLEEGGIVLPRSVTQAEDPSKEAAKFVAAILAKKGKLK